MLKALLEGLAVVFLAAVVWVTVHPAAGAAIGTGYVILLANQDDAGDGGDEGHDAGDR